MFYRPSRSLTVSGYNRFVPLGKTPIQSNPCVEGKTTTSKSKMPTITLPRLPLCLSRIGVHGDISKMRILCADGMVRTSPTEVEYRNSRSFSQLNNDRRIFRHSEPLSISSGRITSQGFPLVTLKGGVPYHGATHKGWFDNPRPFRYFRRMEPLLDSYGYPALFALSFLASTLIPLVQSGFWP